jgi:hypothetical protein
LGHRDQEQCHDAERADVRRLHHGQCPLGVAVAAKSVGGVGQPVQVQACGRRSEGGDSGGTGDQSGQPQHGGDEQHRAGR